MNPDDVTDAPTQQTETTQQTTMPEARPTTEAGAPVVPPREEQQEATGLGISLRKLNAFYGEVHAVKDVDLEYAANRVTAMIGPSGCGKSTLVRCINRMHEEIPGARATGKITLDDADIYADDIDVVSVRRQIGMVFQKPNPLDRKSVV